MTIAQLFADPIDTLAESTGLMDAFGRIAYLLLLIGGLWAFNATKGHRCMCGGLSMFGVLFLPCAAFLDLVLVRCATAFSFREFIRDETLIPEGMRDLHPAGGGPSKRGLVWKYDGPHGTGEVRLFRLVESPEGEVWTPQEFISPAAAWVFYLDELQDEAIMNADTCVQQLYQSLWIFSIGVCVGVFSVGMGIFIARMSSASFVVGLVGMCVAVLRGLIILWRWAADLAMSNHHRGVLLRQGTLPGGGDQLHGLQAIPRARCVSKGRIP